MKRITLIAALAALSIFAVPALAQPVLDFSFQPPTPGSISYAGGNSSLIGTNLQVDTVIGLFTTLHSGQTYQILNGALNFSTGAFDGYVNNHTEQAWFFGPGGTFRLTGCVDVLSPGDHHCESGDPQGTLISGRFEDVSVTAFGRTFKILGAEVFNISNAQLASYFGINPHDNFVGDLNLSFLASGSPPHSFRSTTALSGDFSDSPVPEPGSVFLLGSGFVTLGAFAKRKLCRR